MLGCHGQPDAGLGVQDDVVEQHRLEQALLQRRAAGDGRVAGADVAQDHRELVAPQAGQHVGGLELVQGAGEPCHRRSSSSPAAWP